MISKLEIEINQCIELAVKKELERSKLLHQKGFASQHEAESVFREELEEVETEIENIKDSFRFLWHMIKEHEADKYEEWQETFDNLQNETDMLLQEAVQLKAMAMKWQEMFKED